MARIRTAKPELFKHEGLYDLEKESGLPIRFAWVGLFTCCDREGRFKWRPRQLKSDILPYDEVDFSRVLDALFTRGFIVKYRVDSEDYGYIPTWGEHQVINNREAISTLPAPEKDFSIQPVDACLTRGEREVHVMVTPLMRAQAEGKGKEGRGREIDASPKNEFPEGLGSLAYARGILERQGLPLRDMQQVLAEAIDSYSKSSSLPLHESAQFVDGRMGEDRGLGVLITRFWVSDGKYLPKVKPADKPKVLNAVDFKKQQLKEQGVEL